MNERTDPQASRMESHELEIIPPSHSGLASATAEIGQQIATARKFPRPAIQELQNKLTRMVTANDDLAAECTYALPRGNKELTGPSVRFAEAAAYVVGNNRVSTEYVGIDRENGFVIIKGIYLDLEQNSLVQAIETRRCTYKNGKVFDADVLAVTVKAALAIGRRNAILTGIPKLLWLPAWQASIQLVTGDPKSFDERRAKAIKAFETFNITPETVFQMLGVQNESFMRPNHLPILRSYFVQIKDGEQTPESILRARSADERGFEQVADPLADTVAVEAEPQKAKAEQPKPEPAKAPTNDAEYKAHALAWIEAAKAEQKVTTTWENERPLRTTCKLSEDTVVELTRARDKKLQELRGGKV